MKIKDILPVIAGAIIALLIGFTYTANSPSSPAVGGGLGTIDQLSQWFFDGVNITQNTPGTPVKITGLESRDCIGTSATGVLQSGTCTGGGGGSGLATTSIDTEAELEAILTDVSNVFTNNDGNLNDDNLSNNTTSDLPEGSNLYYTVARIQTALTAGYNAIFGNSTSTNQAITGNFSFGGITSSTWSTFCTAITGGAGLCDGSDATGGGGSGISTSTTPTPGQLPYWTSTSELGSVATGTLTESVTGLQFNQTRGLVGGSAILSITSGYNIPLTASTTNWNTAYNWGNHASAGYITDGNTNWDNSYGFITSADDTVSGSELDGVFSTTGLLKRTGANTYSTVTDNSTNWDTAFGWGNHATQGYLATTSGNWAGTFDGLEGTSYLARANHTGTQLAATISDFVSNVRTSISETITGLAYNSGTGVLSIDAGYSIPLTASTTEWSLAYASTTNMTPAYTRGLFSNTATGLTYNSGTGLTSLTAGYNIPLTASTTDWSTFRDTPSTRITAGNGLAWTGNTLSATSTHAAVTLSGALDYITLVGQDIVRGAIDLATDITGVLGIAAGGLGAAFTDPNTDQIMFWDDSVGAIKSLTSLVGLSISGTTLTVNDVTCTDCLTSTEIADEYLLNNGDVGTGVYDFGGTTSFEITNGSNPTVDTLGEIALDTTGDQLLVADSSAIARVIQIEDQLIWSRTIASTSPAFTNAGLMPLTTRLDGFTITRIQCHVVTGTNKVIAIEDASGNSSEDITCTTSNTTDDGSITNATYTASELAYIDFGATSGSVDYVNISVFGNWTRE